MHVRGVVAGEGWLVVVTEHPRLRSSARRPGGGLPSLTAGSHLSAGYGNCLMLGANSPGLSRNPTGVSGIVALGEPCGNKPYRHRWTAKWRARTVRGCPRFRYSRMGVGPVLAWRAVSVVRSGRGRDTQSSERCANCRR